MKQLRTLAVEVLRDGDVVYSPPWHKISGRTLWVRDAGPVSDRPGAASLDYWLAGGDQLKAVFLDQLAIEIRRQRLFAGTRQQLIIEPHYRRMEEVVAAELAIVQGADDDEEKQRQLDERLKQLGDLLKTGIDSAARDMRLAGAFVEPGHDDGTLWLDRLFAIYLPRQGQINGPVNYPQLQQGVAQAIREKALIFEAPNISVNAGSLTVVDVGLTMESPRRLARIEEVAAELAKLELRRRHPIQHAASRSIMESVYAQMEQVIRQRLNELRQAGAASADAIRAEAAPVSTGEADSVDGGEEPRTDHSRFGQTLEDLLKRGLERCAQNMGNLRLDFSGSPNVAAAPAQTIRLVAPTGTRIEFVHNADRKLWLLSGKPEEDYPWIHHKAGDAVDLSGGYWFRLTYSDGRQIRLYKKITANQRELRFPER